MPQRAGRIVVDTTRSRSRSRWIVYGVIIIALLSLLVLHLYPWKHYDRTNGLIVSDSRPEGVAISLVEDTVIESCGPELTFKVKVTALGRLALLDARAFTGLIRDEELYRGRIYDSDLLILGQLSKTEEVTINFPLPWQEFPRGEETTVWIDAKLHTGVHHLRVTQVFHCDKR